jgi:hypothetical protein
MGLLLKSSIGVRVACALLILSSAGCHRENTADREPITTVEAGAAKAATVSVGTCLHDLRGLPAEAARLAVGSGDSRVFIVDRNGYVAHWRVPGIEPTTSRECTPDLSIFGHGPFVHSRLLDGLFTPDPKLSDADPPYSKCGITRLNWARSYNREIARLMPSAISKVCGPFKVSDHDLGDLPPAGYAMYAPAKGL